MLAHKRKSDLTAQMEYDLLAKYYFVIFFSKKLISKFYTLTLLELLIHKNLY